MPLKIKPNTFKLILKSIFDSNMSLMLLFHILTIINSILFINNYVNKLEYSWTEKEVDSKYYTFDENEKVYYLNFTDSTTSKVTFVEYNSICTNDTYMEKCLISSDKINKLYLYNFLFVFLLNMIYFAYKI